MKARLSIGSAVGALGLLIAAACSSSTPTPPDSDVASFCADWATAYCQLATSCEFDPTACNTFQTGACTSFATAAQASGTRQYDQGNGKGCIDALNSAYGGNPTSISADTLASIADTCNRAFAGKQASDQACTSDYDCSGNLICAPLPGSAAEVCGAVNQKNLGDICGDPGDECQGDSYCAPVANAAPQCIATPATGSACSASIPCGSADHCENDICTPRATLGMTCATNDDCSSSASYCDTYPPAACTTGLTFGRGSIDCQGIAGTDEPTGTTPIPIPDAGPDSAPSSTNDAAGDAPND